MKRRKLFMKCMAVALSAAMTVSGLGVTALAENQENSAIEEEQNIPEDEVMEDELGEEVASPSATPSDEAKESIEPTASATPSELPEDEEDVLETPTETPTATPSEDEAGEDLDEEATPTETPSETPSEEESEDEALEEAEGSESPSPSETPTETPTATPTETPTATPIATPEMELEDDMLEGMAVSDIFRVAADGVTIIGFKADYDTTANLVIPSWATGIGASAFYNNKSIKSISFEAGSKLTQVGASAFEGCINIASIELPNTLVTIENHAFARCSITEINIPATVRTLGYDAFEECSALKKVIINSNFTTDKSHGVFYKTSIDTVIFNNVTKIPAYLFYQAGFDSGYNLVIPQSVTSIGREAFCNSNLSKVTFEEGAKITQIGASAFEGCTNITSLELPNKLQTIENHAFARCSITEINIPATVRNLGYDAFEKCTALKKVVINSNFTTDKSHGVFYKTSIDTVIFNNVTKIPAVLFAQAGFENGAVINIPSTITSIGDYGFDMATGVGTVINIPASVKTIGYKAFTSKDMSYRVVKGSVADTWLKNNGLGDYIINILPINYYLNGGTNNAENPVSFETGDTITLKNPTRTGYNFEGWYTDSRFTNKVTSVTGGQAAINLYAKWTPIVYNITYVNNGATTDVTAPATYTIQSTTITLKNPVRTGYTFAGWYKDAGFAGTPVKTIPAKSMGDVTLYAKWTEYSYKLSFNANAGKFETGKQPATATYAFTENVTLPDGSIIQAREGYTLKGWNTLATGKGTHYDLGDMVSGLSTVNNKAITLNAEWKVNEYTISYDLDGGTQPVDKNGNSLNPAKRLYTAATALKTPVKTGYTFGGWYTDPGFAATSKVTSIKARTASDVTVYAKWTENSYKVTFNVNGGKFETGKQPAVAAHLYSAKFNLPASDVMQSRTGYTLMGWNTKANGTGTHYGFNAEVSGLSDKNNASVILYAEWKVNEYNINYELNGGTQPVDRNGNSLNPDKRLYTAAVALKNPVKTGYTFGGWYTDSEFKALSKVTSIKTRTAEDVTVYAKWTANKYSVTFNANTGRGIMTKMTGCEYDKKYTLTANKFTKAGYTFTGWNTKANGTGTAYAEGAEIENLIATNNGNVILYAQWAKN